MARGAKGQFGLAGIFDNVRDGLVLVRFPQKEVVLFNRAASELCGIPIDEALGAGLERIFKDSEVHETARKCSEQPVGVWPGHSQVVLQTNSGASGGHRNDVELHFCRVDDVGTGGPLVLLVMRPRAEAELAAAIRKGETAQRRIEELESNARERALFFSEAAHELNTPLTIVALQTDLLRGALGRVQPVQERALDTIKGGIHRLVLLSRDLADLARADAGRLVLQPVPVDLARLTREEVESFQPFAEQQQLSIGFASSGKPATVAGEPARLRQVLGSFLGNAIKFTPHHGRVTADVSTTPDGWAAVRIQDTRPGLDGEDQAQLFRPFARTDAPDAPAKPETGLGLYLSKRIVEAHGGQAGCSSPGSEGGMAFWFKIPLTRPDALPPSQPIEAPRHGRAQRPVPVRHAQRASGPSKP